MTSQLALDLPRRLVYDESDFFVTARNGRAFGLVGQWPDWHAPAAVIWGPPQSGKTYLAHIWKARANAAFADPAALDGHVWAAPRQPLVLEDVDASPLPETALFHHLNLAREHGSFILLTARTPPGSWRIALPDLRSRIRSYPTAEIQPPDEEHLSALLLKHFSDRGIEIAPDVIAYLVQRIERSMAAADAVASLLDKAALAERRRVTRAFAAKVLRAVAGGPEFDDDAPKE
ncbi:hypothetical protein KKP04_04720 [Rhodomicrobium sp. Az07]|uniref:HdaA/DnaA family protein n=1 Tax=Rhodomicrobium sp. Az07 TaxID=2839034 RepID=UPI001BEC561F|nr:DnaA/Hda family protein [Rhodomicrobium sp. Az07]MBT3070172.1 hypothetical protein [Rhodomicrobium sp. Az07]